MWLSPLTDTWVSPTSGWVSHSKHSLIKSCGLVLTSSKKCWGTCWESTSCFLRNCQTFAACSASGCLSSPAQGMVICFFFFLTILSMQISAKVKWLHTLSSLTHYTSWHLQILLLMTSSFSNILKLDRLKYKRPCFLLLYFFFWGGWFWSFVCLFVFTW